MCVAPNSFAHASLRSSMSTAMIVGGTGERGAGDRRVAHTAAAEHGDRVAAVTPPVFIAAPSPAITPQPSRPAAAAGA